MKKIAISPGDPAGVGPDICLKAFKKNINQDSHPVFFGDPNLFEERAKFLNIDIDIEEYENGDELDQNKFYVKPHQLNSKITPGNPDPGYAEYIIEILKEAIQLNLSGEFSALITGPVNKELINKGGIAFKGHTEVLAKESKTEKVVMMLANDSLKVALATTHEPLKNIPSLITQDHISDCISIIDNDLKNKWKIKKPNIRVLGLNPHAGDGGYIGKEDKEIILPAIEGLKRKGIKVEGPVSADTAFVDFNQEPDVILAMFHDQGLPVIKTTGFGKSINITLGLPFIRTSVDHGTAYDASASKSANESSFIQAYKLASKLINKHCEQA
tara:strand:+ start:1 stop:984 length:984 start_codon:yes stop_codon:yes gene_type:complete